MELRDIIRQLESAKGYMLGVSIVNENGQIEHTLITENFQIADMLPSQNHIKQLAIQQVESPPNVIDVPNRLDSTFKD